MLKIIVIDCNILFREGLTNLLQKEPGIQVVGEAGTIYEAVYLVKSRPVDLVLVDIEVPDLNHFDGVRMLRIARPETQVVVLSNQDSDELFFQAIRNGARGFLPKSNSLNSLMASLRAVERGEAAIPRAMVGRLLDGMYRQAPGVERGETSQLTRRELDVLRELGAGHSNRQIAEALMIAENTVKVHVHNVLEKLNLRNRRQAARYARIHGIWKAGEMNGDKPVTAGADPSPQPAG